MENKGNVKKKRMQPGKEIEKVKRIVVWPGRMKIKVKGSLRYIKFIQEMVMPNVNYK